MADARSKSRGRPDGEERGRMIQRDKLVLGVGIIPGFMFSSVGFVLGLALGVLLR
jgi:hypothetical protein